MFNDAGKRVEAGKSSKCCHYAAKVTKRESKLLDVERRLRQVEYDTLEQQTVFGN